MPNKAEGVCHSIISRLRRHTHMHTRVPILPLRECSVTPLHGERLEYKRSEGWKRRVSAMKLSSLFAVSVLCFHLAREDSPIPIPLTNTLFRCAPICCLLCNPLLFCCAIPYHFTVCLSIHRFAVRLSLIISLCVYLSCRSAVRLSILSFRCASIYPIVPL